MLLEIVKSLQGVIEGLALGKAAPPVKVFDLIQNRHFGSVNTVQQKGSIRFEQSGNVKILPSRRISVGRHNQICLFYRMRTSSS